MIYDIVFILQCKVSTTAMDRLGRCFRFVCICACTAVFLCCCSFSVNKDLYKLKNKPIGVLLRSSRDARTLRGTDNPKT